MLKKGLVIGNGAVISAVNTEASKQDSVADFNAFSIHERGLLAR